MNETLVLAHSPDSDDAFMFYGLRENAVDTEGVSYRHELADIETLNERALSGELAITAVSFHAYAYLADRYLLLPHGASFGDGYGPCVVAREAAGAPQTLADLAGRRVAIPGRLTSAALAPRGHAVRPCRRGRDAGRRGSRRRHPRRPAHVEGRGLPPRGGPRRRVEGRDLSAAAARRQRRAERSRAGAHRARVARSRPIHRLCPRPSRGRPHGCDALRAGPPAREGRPLRLHVRERMDALLWRARTRGRAPLSRARARGGSASNARDAGMGGRELKKVWKKPERSSAMTVRGRMVLAGAWLFVAALW